MSVTQPACHEPIEKNHAPQAATRLLTPNPEDHHLAKLVERALRETGYWALRTVRVSVRTRVVFLGGRVPRYYLKQLAQATALAVPGVHQVCNDLNVIP